MLPCTTHVRFSTENENISFHYCKHSLTRRQAFPSKNLISTAITRKTVQKGDGQTRVPLVHKSRRILYPLPRA